MSVIKIATPSDVPATLHGCALAGTGHRPSKLCGGYSPRAHVELRAFARSWVEALRPRGVITGMALGWDTALAEAAIEIGLPFVAAIPFIGQESRWPTGSKQIYRALLARAARVKVVCPGGYSAEAMQRRNVWMCEKAELTLALWNNEPGGTANYIHYALARGRDVVNVWNDYYRLAEAA